MSRSYRFAVPGTVAALAVIATLSASPAFAQETDDVMAGPDKPLARLSFLIGTWGFTEEPTDDGFQLTFRWGKADKAIAIEAPIMEGLVFWHPDREKIVYYAHQTRSNLLFEGEYEVFEDGRIQRIYTVYAADPRNNNNRFRETLTPQSETTMHWLTERFVDGEWEPFGPNPEGAIAYRWR